RPRQAPPMTPGPPPQITTAPASASLRPSSSAWSSSAASGRDAPATPTWRLTVGPAGAAPGGRSPPAPLGRRGGRRDRAQVGQQLVQQPDGPRPVQGGVGVGALWGPDAGGA